MSSKEARYKGYNMVGDVTVFVTKVSERCVYVDNKKQEDRLTYGGVPISRISGFGIIGGSTAQSISLDVPDSVGITVKEESVVVASETGVVNVRDIDDFGNQTTTTFATSIKNCGDAKEIITAGIAASMAHATTSTAASRKEIAN